MAIIGTAGHVDHGKSTLVMALTGRDPDRWAEEKERGLTIDLGFAWALLGSEEVGFVDVPGHERFIKNMLAGVGAIDVALLVVAADEGWMPQTEEHAAVLDLLEVEHGVIAITRTDLVDTDTLELAHLMIQEEVAGSCLEPWPLVPVVAPDGTGLDELVAALIEQLTAAGATRDLGRPRLWVDRAFTISGAGAVVTGTLSGGTVAVGDELELWPGRRPVRVRGIQSHEADVDSVGPGRRTALNLSGIDHDEVGRGACLAAPGTLRASRQILGSFRSVRTLENSLTDRGAYHLHIGSGAWPTTVRFVDVPSQQAAGSVLMSLDRDLAAEIGDRFILREVGRRAVVGGGTVLDPHPIGKLVALRDTIPGLETALGEGPDARAQALLEIRGRARLTDLAADSGGGVPRVGIIADTEAISVSETHELAAAAVGFARDYQVENPLRAGLPRGELLTRLSTTTEVLARLLATVSELVDDGATIRTADFSGGWSPEEERSVTAARATLTDAGLAVPRASQIGLKPELLHACIRSGVLVKVADDLVYLPEQLVEITDTVQTLDNFTVAEFRDALNVSRRQAVPLLEWLDAGGWTVRRGDVRTVK